MGEPNYKVKLYYSRQWNGTTTINPSDVTWKYGVDPEQTGTLANPQNWSISFTNSNIGNSKEITISYTDENGTHSPSGYFAMGFADDDEGLEYYFDIVPVQLYWDSNDPNTNLFRMYDGTTTLPKQGLSNYDPAVHIFTYTLDKTFSTAIPHSETLDITYTFTGQAITDGNIIPPATLSFQNCFFTIFRYEISQEHWTLNGTFSIQNKTYDNTINATINQPIPTVTITGGLFTGETDVIVNFVAEFESSFVGTGKNVTITYVLGGTDGSKYALLNNSGGIATWSATADITEAPEVQASLGSDPHIYKLSGKKIDMINPSSRKWYSIYKNNDLSIKGHFSSFNRGAFFDSVKIEKNGESIDIDFNKQNIKGKSKFVEQSYEYTSIKYKNTTSDKSQGLMFNDSKYFPVMKIKDEESPLKMYIDFSRRYLHFKFPKTTIPSECSGLIV
jgi:hypothetical protein